MDNPENFVPMIAYAVVGVGVIALLLRFKRQNDLKGWMRDLHATAERAVKDPEFRQGELRDAEARLAAYSPPSPIQAVTQRQEMITHGLPKFLFILGAGGVALLFLGLFLPPEGSGSNSFIYIGPVLLAVTLVGILVTTGNRRLFHHIRQLNRKYVMQKAAGDVDALIPTVNTILEYYPKVPELWLEKADQLSRGQRLPEALEAIKQARELAPKSIDIAVVEVSFLLRNGNLQEAAKRIGELEELKQAETDPRVELYAAKLALMQNEKRKALKHAERASELDSAFATRFLQREDSLADLAEMMRENKLIF